MDKKILLDTNIIIHRETNSPINADIGKLFNWIDKLKDRKYIHPLTPAEISKHRSTTVKSSYKIKLDSYNTLVESALAKEIIAFSKQQDKNDNDRNDTKLLNEVFVGAVDFLITEDIPIHKKARLLGIAHKVFFIESYIEKVTAENPPLADYKTLSTKQEYFARIDLSDPFFDSFKQDYKGFESWFRKKSDEKAYICKEKQAINAFLYVKIEDKNTSYHDITPVFSPKKRLKIGTLKVELNGFKIGERFLKIIFDNAFRNKVEEIYVTIFNNAPNRERLIRLLTGFGFYKHGIKISSSGQEEVFVRKLNSALTTNKPLASYPYINNRSRKFLVPIFPEYHTKLLPDSILQNENPLNFQENTSFGNAILKSYISHSEERGVQRGDIIVFYRTGGYYKSVLTTIGEIDSVEFNFTDCQDFIDKCGKRSVFKETELISLWKKYGSRNYRPFIINFLYIYSFPTRINLKKMIELGIIADINSAPRGFQRISDSTFNTIIRATNTDPYFLV
jgi:predicted nucleic acid-binding protein